MFQISTFLDTGKLQACKMLSQSFFPRDVLDEILNLIESVSVGFPTYSFNSLGFNELFAIEL